MGKELLQQVLGCVTRLLARHQAKPLNGKRGAVTPQKYPKAVFKQTV